MKWAMWSEINVLLTSISSLLKELFTIANNKYRKFHNYEN